MFRRTFVVAAYLEGWAKYAEGLPFEAGIDREVLTLLDIHDRVDQKAEDRARMKWRWFADRIGTPMLVIHGNRDYRVPVSEALRLWWDLVKRWDGEPEQLPHRFLNLTNENHWVLSPANAEIWYDTVLGFCAQHVLGEKWEPSALLP